MQRYQVRPKQTSLNTLLVQCINIVIAFSSARKPPEGLYISTFCVVFFSSMVNGTVTNRIDIRSVLLYIYIYIYHKCVKKRDDLSYHMSEKRYLRKGVVPPHDLEA